MDPIPQVLPYFDQREVANLTEAIDTRWVSEGPFSEEFCQRLTEVTGSEYAVLSMNGTVALFLSIRALGIGPGDEVIVPDFTFATSGSSVSMAGATPVFADTDPDTFQVDVADVEEKITDDTAAIMPVHIYGQSVEMDPIMDLAADYHLDIVEDAAQSIGVSYRGEHLGTIGDIGMISFDADKTVTTGQGGVVLTDDEELYEEVTRAKNMGRLQTGTYKHETIALNSRFTDLQAAVGVAQFEKFDEIVSAKRENYRRYRENLDGVSEITWMEKVDGSGFVPFRAPVRADDSAVLQEYLETNGIETRGFFYPLHLQPCFDHLGYEEDDFPGTTRIYEDGFCLPVFPELEDDEIDYICEKIRTFYE